MAGEGIRVFDPYKNEMVAPDMNILAHRIAVTAQKAAMANEPTTDFDNDNPDLATGPVTTSGVEIVPTQDTQAPGTSRNADELAASGEDAKAKKDK
jgi:hypothetical protein